MPAKSKAQQRFMGMVHAVQKGDMDAPSKEVEKAADSMSDADAKDYASTKHKGLPNHVKKENMESELKEIIRQTYRESLRESVNEAKIQPKDNWGVRLVAAINNNIDGLYTSVIKDKDDITDSVSAFGTMLKNAIRETLKHTYKPHPKYPEADSKIKTFISELKKLEQLVNMVTTKPTKSGIIKLNNAWTTIWNHKYGAAIALSGNLYNSIVESELDEAKYPTDLKVGSVILGQGFTRLKGVDGGKYYKIVDMDDTTATLVPSDKSGNVKGSSKVRHKLDSIEGGIKTAKRGDENGIVVIKESVIAEDIKSNINKFLDKLNKQFPEQEYTTDFKGGKYARIVQQNRKYSGNRSAWGFVAMEDNPSKGFKKGDLLKAAGFNTPAKGARGNILDGTAKYDKYSPVYLRESVNEAVSHEAMGIASMTNTRKEAVQKFIDDNNLDALEILKVVTKGGLVERVRFIQALVGTPGNSSFKWYVKNYANEGVNEGKKVFKVNPGIGSSKYSISSHNGVKKHKDGSDFYDIEIFKNKVDLEKGIKKYSSNGFVKESVNESDVPSDIIKDLDKLRNDLIKKVEVLIAKKKKLYSNVDITTPMSADEKQLDKDIQSIFSQIQQIIQQKRKINK